MIILGIDPGTSCGWAILDGEHRIASGVWDLRPRRHEGGGMRFLRLRSYLSEVLDRFVCEAVGYEEVRRHLGTDAAHIYGGVVATLSAVLERRKIPYLGIPVGTAKKGATGKGNASKDAMCDAAFARWGHVVEDDNEADALFVALALGRTLGA